MKCVVIMNYEETKLKLMQVLQEKKYQDKISETFFN
jgi:hypothetical protein